MAQTYLNPIQTHYIRCVRVGLVVVSRNATQDTKGSYHVGLKLSCDEGIVKFAQT